MNTTRDPEAVIPAQAGIQKKVRPLRVLYRLAKTSVVLFAFTAACTNAVESLGVLVGCLAPFVDLVEGNVETEPALAELLTVDEFADGHGGMVTVTWNHKHVDITTLTPASLGVVIAGLLSLYTGAPFHPPDPSATQAHEFPLALFPSNEVHVTPPDVFDQVEVFAAESSSLHLVNSQGPDAVRAALEAYLGCDGSEEDEGRHDEVVVTVNTDGTIKDVDGNPLSAAVTSFNVYCAVDKDDRPKVIVIDYLTVVNDKLDWLPIKENCTPEKVEKGEECCNPAEPETCSIIPPRAPIGINFDRAMERMTGVITRTDPNSNCSDLPLERDENGNPIDPNTSECGASVADQGEKHIILVGGAMEDNGKGWPVGARLNLVVPSRGSLFAQESYRSLRALLPNKLNAATNGWGPDPFLEANQPRNFFVSGVKIGSIIRAFGAEDDLFNSGSTVVITDQAFKFNIQIAQMPDPISLVKLTVGSTTFTRSTTPSEPTIEISPNLGHDAEAGVRIVLVEGFTEDGRSVGMDSVTIDWQPRPDILEFKMVAAPTDQTITGNPKSILPCAKVEGSDNTCPTAVFTKGFDPQKASLEWNVAWATSVDIQVSGPSPIAGLAGKKRTDKGEIAWSNDVQTGSYEVRLIARNDRHEISSVPIHFEIKDLPADTKPVIKSFTLTNAPQNNSATSPIVSIAAGSGTTAFYVKGFDPLTSSFSYTVEWANSVTITGGPFQSPSATITRRSHSDTLQGSWSGQAVGEYNLVLEAVGTDTATSAIIKAKLEDPPTPSIEMTFTGVQADGAVQWTVTGCPSVATGSGGITRTTGSFTSRIDFQPLTISIGNPPTQVAVDLMSPSFWPSVLETRTKQDGSTEQVRVEKPITSRSFDSSTIGGFPTFDITQLAKATAQGNTTITFSAQAKNSAASTPSSKNVAVGNSTISCCLNTDCNSSLNETCHFPGSFPGALCGIDCRIVNHCQAGAICSFLDGACFQPCTESTTCPVGQTCFVGVCTALQDISPVFGAPSRASDDHQYQKWPTDVCAIKQQFSSTHRAYDFDSFSFNFSPVHAMDDGEVVCVFKQGTPRSELPQNCAGKAVEPHLKRANHIVVQRTDRLPNGRTAIMRTVYWHVLATTDLLANFNPEADPKVKGSENLINRCRGHRKITVQAGDFIGVTDQSGCVTGPHAHIYRTRMDDPIADGNALNYVPPPTSTCP